MKTTRFCKQCNKPLTKYWQVKYCCMQCAGLARRNYEIKYTFSSDGTIGYGKLLSGETFMFDSEDFPLICDTMWYGVRNGAHGEIYIEDCKTNRFHRIVIKVPDGFIVDHINMNTLDNRKCNLRICTHRQNLCNRGRQSNNISRVPGVQWKHNRRTWNARIKHFGKDIHLGAYQSFNEAVQARNEGMRILFGEFGRYNDVPEAPHHIKEYVRDKCSRYLESGCF